MEWLNYHHLLYFWTLVRHGGLVAAARALRLSPATVSVQVKQLESVLGEALVTKEGRKLVPTDTGRTVFAYADEIFSLGRELLATVKKGPEGKPVRVAVGVVDAIPKLVAKRVLVRGLAGDSPIVVTCREGSADELEAGLAGHHLDIVLSDAPARQRPGTRLHTHALGSSPVAFYAIPRLVKRFREGFPGSLEGGPLLVPTSSSSLRGAIDAWLARKGLAPVVVGEFDDSALLKAFAHEGLGFFAAPTLIERDIATQYGVRRIGRLDGVRETYFALTAERKIRHPIAALIAERAREALKSKAPARPDGSS